MADALTRMEESTRRRPSHAAEDLFHEADIAFHQALIAATGNRALGVLVERIHGSLLAARYPLARPQYRIERALPEHRRIIAAVAQGDPVAAREAMTAHLETIPYAAAKSGLVGLTRSLALDLGPDAIRVNCVAPGFTRTRLVQDSIDRAQDPAANEARMVSGVALGRIAEPIEVARAIRFLASDEASYITGASLLVDGGLTARRAG
jgi:NAD(P)-dependent dehydrogenase (short-subunit alcohol dehydrogenase family)